MNTDREIKTALFLHDAKQAIQKLADLEIELTKISSKWDLNAYTINPSEENQDLYWDVKKALHAITPLMGIHDLGLKSIRKKAGA